VRLGDVTLTLATPGLPEPLTYVIEIVGAAGTGVTINGLVVVWIKEIKTVTAGAGKF
jgi:hypothetical protein